MSTIREQIVAAAVTAIGTGAPAGIPAPVRTRIDSPSADQLPVLTIYQAVETVDPMRDPRAGRPVRGPVVRRALTLNVEIITKAGAGQDPDKTADPIMAWVTKALGAAGTFGDLANNPADEVGTKFDYEQGETSFCRATMAFRIQYQSRADDAELLT